PGDRVDRLDVAAIALRDAGVEQNDLAEALLQLVWLDRVTGPAARLELGRLNVLVASPQRPQPASEVEHRAVVVSEVAQQPPEPLGAAHRAVRHDEITVADTGSPGCLRELRLARQRVPSAGTRRRGEVLLDVEEGRTGDVPLEVELAAARRIPQLPPAVDELVPHPATLAASL